MPNLICPHCDNVQPCAKHPRTKPYKRRPAFVAMRPLVLARDPICRAIIGCKERTTDVDHIIAVKDGGTDTMDNLIGLCHSHHSSKTVRRDGGFGRGQA